MRDEDLARHPGSAAGTVLQRSERGRCEAIHRPNAFRRCGHAAERSRAPTKDTPMLMTILLVVLVLSLIGGGLGHSRFGYAGWSPAGIILAIVLVLFLTGRLG